MTTHLHALAEKFALRQVSMQLAYTSQIDENPDWDMGENIDEDPIQATLVLDDGSTDGEVLRVTGCSINQLYRKMRNEILVHYGQRPLHNDILI